MKLFKRNSKVNTEHVTNVEPVHHVPDDQASVTVPPHTHHEPPLPPHLRRGIERIVFDENELPILIKAYGNEDNAIAAMRYLNEDAPPEMQILAIQAMANISSDFSIKAINAEGFNAHGAYFPIAGMDNSAKTLYKELYGEAGTGYIDVFRASPKEISVISRLLACSHKQK